MARFLREGGFNGRLELVPKGKTEPYSGVVRGDFSQEDLYQLDRRVELSCRMSYREIRLSVRQRKRIRDLKTLAVTL